MIVKLEDMRPAGVCVEKTKVWFRRSGLNWRDFAKNGIEAQRLLDVGTKREEVLRVIEAAGQHNG